MKAAVCELCGSNELRKEGGDYVCQHCGTHYAPEEAKKLLVDVKVSGTIQVDGIATVNSLNQRAWQEEQAGHLKAALEYYQRAEEADPMSTDAQAGIKRINDVYDQRVGFDALVGLAAGGIVTLIDLVLCMINGAPSLMFALGIVLAVLVACAVHAFMRGISYGKGLARDEDMPQD